MATSDTVPGSVATSGNVQQDSVDPYGPWGIAKALAGGGGGGGVALAQTAVVTSAHTAAAGEVVRADISGGPVTVTLPHAPAAGTLVTVKVTANAAGNTNACTVACAGADVINKAGGAASMLLTLQGQSALLEYNSGIWAVLATDDAAAQLATVRQGVFYADAQAGTDDQKMAAALAAAVAAGGGTVVLSARAHTFAAQWATTYSAGVAVPLKIQGAGAGFNGLWGTPSGATTCTFTYSGAGAAMCDFQHIGTIEVTGIQFRQANTGKPFFFVSNPTPLFHENVFSGGASGVSCVTDVFVLGGTGTTVGAGDTAPFQGYGGHIRDNFFDGIRRACTWQNFANSVQVTHNTISASCGSSGLLDGPFYISPSPGQNAVGNVIAYNTVELVSYKTAICAPAGALSCTFGPNGLWDASAGFRAYHYLGPLSNFNQVFDGWFNDAYPLMMDLSGTSSKLTANQSQFSLFAQKTQFRLDCIFTASGLPYYYDSYGNAGLLQASGSATADPSLIFYKLTGTRKSDGNVVSGSRYITSATAAFAAANIDYPLRTATGGMAGFVAATYTTATAPAWQASAAYSAGDIARPTSANAHMYQVTVAGTTAASAPTWPTGGGTVTDGGVTWQDLGAVTAALVTGAASSTASGVNFSFGPASGLTSMLWLTAGHLITSPASTAAVAAGAGAGTSPTIAITGSDVACRVTLTTGTSPAAGLLATVSFATAYVYQSCSLTPRNAAAAGLGLYATGSTNLAVNCTTAPSAATQYIFDVITLG